MIGAKQNAGMILLAEGYTWYDAQYSRTQASITINLDAGRQVFSTCIIKNDKISKKEIIGMLEAIIKEI